MEVSGGARAQCPAVPIPLQFDIFCLVGKIEGRGNYMNLFPTLDLASPCTLVLPRLSVNWIRRWSRRGDTHSRLVRDTVGGAATRRHDVVGSCTLTNAGESRNGGDVKSRWNLQRGRV